MAHWTVVLSNVSLAEFVLLAVLTAWQWMRHHIRGAGWVALSFVVVGGLSLALQIDPSLVDNQNTAKSFVAVLLLVPYFLFRFAASFRRPSRPVGVLALALTAAMIGFTFWLADVPVRGTSTPPHFVAYQIAFLVSFAFLVGYVVARLVVSARREPAIAAWRMRLVAVALTGLGLPVVVEVLSLHGATVELVTRALTVVMGVLLLMALVLPSFVRVLLSRREDPALRAVGELVSARDSEEVANRLLPHVRALVGASEAALVAADGTVVARSPLSFDRDIREMWGRERVTYVGRDSVTVRTTSGASHALAVRISSSMPYFGTEELHQLDQLADLVGLAIERCELAEQTAFQASHDGLTGLANRGLFMERLDEALRHVGRRRASLAVLFIDLDRFKMVNDRADHAAGDHVLNEMADRMMAMTRGVDVVARFGGDEFVAFAEVDHEEDATDMAERIRRGLGTPLVVGNTRLVVTASIGVVVTADASLTAAALLRDADDAMYEAKRAGRNQVVVHPGTARRVADRRWGLERTPDAGPQRRVSSLR